MIVSLHNGSTKQILLEKEYPDTYFNNDGEIMECVTDLKSPYGSGKYHEICFKNVHIGFGTVALRHKVLLHLESDSDSVEMHFTLKGKTTAASGNFHKTVHFDNAQHNIIYAHQMCGSMEFEGPEMQFLEINLSPHFFKRFLPDHSEIFNTFRNSIEKQRSCLIHPEHHRISFEMSRILNDIINCSRTGIFKKIFLEAKIIELLLLQLEQFFKNERPKPFLSGKDQDKIYAVRDYLVQNIDQYRSLTDLAHQVGTNEFTLKKGFKEIFGTTVFNFWNTIKMEQAKKMLLHTDLNISEISELTGYKNPRHFSAAFKRQYHVIPSKFKNNRLT